MKKNLTMQLLPLWLLAFFFFASVPIKAQTTPKASITKLIGCLPAPDADKAEVKITVDQDKVTDYTYNFNGTYTTNNVGKLTKGAKTILVKKTAGGQVYSVNINIPDKTATPTFTPVITYNCNGTADVRLTNNQGTYNYTYTYGGNTHNSPYFRDLAVGQHTVTVKYTAPATTKSIVFYDDFGKYDGGAKSVKSPYVNQTIFFDPMDGTNQVKPDGSTRPKTTVDSYYAIGRRAELSPGTPNNSWILPNDKDKDLNGRYLWYNVALTPAEKTVYKRKAKVTPGLPVEFSTYVYNPINKAAIPTGYVPDVSLKIFRSEADFNSDTPMYSSDNTESIPKETNLDNWTRMSVTTNVRNTDTELIFVIYINGGGNDLCVDNVLVTQPSITCEQTVTVPVNVVTNTNVYSTTVTYNCAANNGTITVTPSVTTGYDYTYSLNGGTPQTSGSFVKNAGSYTITVTSKVKGSKILFKEDFGSGGTYLMPTSVIPTPFVGRLGGEGYPSDILAEGNYQIANQGNLVQRTTWNWLVPLDRTSNGTKADGRYLAFNYGANATSYFYKQDIQVMPNKPITIEYYVYNLNKSNVVSNFPNIETTFWNKATNTVITSSTKVSGNITGNTHNKDWRKVTHTFTPPPGVTDLQLRFRNTNNDTGANDFAIDDILVTQAYDTCTTTLTATVAPKVTQAFAGVTRLIGCGTGANANKAEVTITNVQGGTGAYEYNFDGTWVATNTGWLAAGTHTVSVRAVGTGNSCQYDMSVTVLAAIAQPTIKTAVHYACDGKAILNIGVENPDPELTYMYSLDGGAYTTTYVYTNVASGTHSISVQYEHRSVPSPSLLFREDFGTGTPTALPGPASDYGLTYGTTYPIGGGSYQIVSQAQAPSYWKLLTPFGTCVKGNPAGIDKRWVSVYDHTSGGTDPTGRFYMSDFKGTQADGDLFYKREVNVLPGADINYEFYALNLFREDSTEDPGKPGKHALKPNVVVRLVAPNGTVVASTTTGEIPNSVCATNLADNLKNWRKYEGKLNVGTYTKLTVEIRSVGSALHGWGNDMALDDITVNMIPKSCGQVISATKVVTANAHDIPAFTVSKTYDCATGKGTLTVTPTATTGFTYTYTLGSTTYTSTTATFTALDLEQTYTVSVSYQAVSNTITLLNEDFGTGTVTRSPYVPSKYYFQKLDGNPTKNRDGQTRAGSTTTPRDQDYRVAKELGVTQPFWHTNVKDHTGNTDGRMLFIWPKDAVGEIVYQREISVLPNNDIDYSLWAKYYVVGAGPAGGNPTVQAALYKSLADVAANTNAIPVNGAVPVTHTIPGNNVWTQLSYKVKAADVGNVTKLYLVVRDNTVNPSGGNDLALDDIVVTQKLPACTTSVTATLTKGDVATPTLTLPANLSVICSAPTASATISSWIASATATSTCGTATVTHNYSYPPNLCNVGGAVTVTFSTTDPFGNVVTATRVISFATMTLTVTPTTLSVPNGALGGTTSSVVPNITLGGVASPSTNSVTITFSGLPAGVTTDTQGRIVIPAGTPATSTLVTYSVCEKLNPTNCHTVTSTLVIGTGSLTVTPTNLIHPNGTQGGTTTGTVLTGVKINGNPVNTASVTITWNSLPPNATGNASGTVTIAPNTPAGTYTISYTVCERLNGNSNCQSVTSQITVGGGSLTATPTTLTHPNGTQGGTTTGTVLTGVKINGNPVNTASVTITWNSLPPNATGNASGTVTIAPNTPAGTYTISYTVCESLNGNSNCQSVTSQITIGGGNMTVTPTTLTHPNGTQGGTTTGTVLTGVKINGNPVNTASVTITWNTLPPNATGNASGTVTIAPNTPAGTYTISYTVCERLNGNSNCQSVTSQITIGGGSLTATPTNLTHPNGTQGGTTTGTVLTGVKINGNPVNTASVTITWNSLPPNATGNASGTVTIAPNTPAGTYTISYTVCERLNGNSNCQSVTSQITIGGGSLTATPTTLTHPNGTQGGTTTGTVLTGVKINGNPVNTASVTITWNSLPPNATGNASGTVTIAPNTPAGTYTISYTVCERLNGNSNCQSVTSQITIGGGSLTATPTNLTHPNGTQGGTTTGTVLTGVKINGNPVNTASVTITWNSLPPNATGNASGTVTIAPNTPAGTYTISYTVCERLNGNSNCQSVTSQITIGGGSLTVTPTQLVVANGATGGTSVNNVLTGVKINGNPVNTNSVTITWNSLPPGFIGTNSGTVTVPANTPAGTYTISYTVCERLNQNNNCKTVTSTITVGNGNMIVVPTPITVPNGTIGGTSTPSVLTGVVLNGNSNPAPNTVSITWNSLPPRATGNNDGTVNVAPNTPAGTYTVSYTICEALNSGHCTTVTSTITIGGGMLTVTPVTTLTVANGAQGGTTTNSVLTGVSLNGQPANSQSVTITFSGLPAGVTSNTNGQLVVAPGTPATNTTIYYTVCETLNANNNCHTYSTTLVIGTPNLSVTPRTYTIPDATVGGTTSSVLETITIDGHTPSSQSVTITFGNLPVGIQTTTSGGFRVPAGTPTGIHTVTYTVCEVLNPDHCVTSIATIAVGNVPVVTPNAFTYTGTATVTTPSILDDDTVGTQSATTGTGGNVVIDITSTPTGTVVPSLDANNGRVTIPAGTPPGIYTITYDVCTTATPTACTPGAVVITIPNVPVITPDDMVYTDTTTTTAGNILTNDRVGTQSATAGNGGNVSITVTIPATPKAPGATVPMLNPNTGVVTVPAGTPSGTYTITYKICTTATPTSCDTGIVTITVSGTVTDAPDTNDVTAYTRINTPVTVGVTSSTTVTVSIPSQPANGTAVSNGDGTITYTPNNGFKGTDSFEYSLCNAAGCRTATISVRVTSELIIYNGVSIGGSDKNNHFHIEGIENYPNNTVRIYNRWGVKVFEMSGYNNTTKAFRGVSDARATLEASDNLPQGTYYYIIEYVDEHNKTQTETGWLYLKKN